mgnify:CR=1 FL=1
MSDLLNIADQFKGLPMDTLIGGPLKAAVSANVMMAQSTADFINTVGFDQVPVDPKDPTKGMQAGKSRTAQFQFQRPGVSSSGARTIEQVKMEVPLLAIVPIPNLQVDTVDVVFDMEVKSSTSSKSSSDKSGKFGTSVQAGWGPFSASISVSGSCSAHKENTRSSDNSAKYHVQVTAKNHGIPEGLARVLDIMADAAKPLDVKSYKPKSDGTLAIDDKTGKPIGKGTPVLPDGAAVEPTGKADPTDDKPKQDETTQDETT